MPSPRALSGSSVTVLLTNDDGYGATGLAAAASALRARGAHVMVVAPRHNHTAGSHRVALHEFEVERLDEGSLVCDGTPADCVRWGMLSGVLPPPDVVVAGINHGANAGEDVFYSGTVAAAREAALLGAPALAASQHGDGPEIPFIVAAPDSFPDAGFVARTAMWLASSGTPPRTLVNLNLPREPMTAEARLTGVGSRDWPAARVTAYESSSGRYTNDPWTVLPPAVLAPGSDYEALSRGLATISVISAGGAGGVSEHQKWVEALPLGPVPTG